MNESYQWVVTYWKELLIAALIFDRFLNNLLTNCPYLKQNKWYDLIQGTFNAIVQTATQVKGQTDVTSKTTIVTDASTTEAGIPASPPDAAPKPEPE